MGRLSLFWLFGLVLLFENGFAETERARERKRSVDLEKKLKRAKSENGLIEFTESLIDEVVLTESRDFDIVLLLSADREKCEFCSQVKRTLGDVLKELMKKDIPLLVEDRKIYFGSIELDANTAPKMKVPAVPVLVHYHSTLNRMKESGRKTSEIKNDYLSCRGRECEIISSKDQLDRSLMQRMDVHEMVLRSIAKNILKRNEKEIVGILREPFFHMKQVVLFGVFFVSIVILFIEQIQKFFISNQFVIASIAVLIFTISTSGLINNLQAGRLQWDGPGKIMKSARQQYLKEGLTYSFASVFFSLSLYFGVSFSNFVAKTHSVRFANKNRVGLLLFSVIAMAASFYAAHRVSIAVQIKHPYLTPTFFPSSSNAKGGIRVDRGYAF